MADELKFAELERKMAEQASQFAELKTQLEGEQTARQAAEATAKTLAEQNTALTDRVTAMEQTARRKRFSELVDGATPWYGAVDTHLNLLENFGSQYGCSNARIRAVNARFRGVSLHWTTFDPWLIDYQCEAVSRGCVCHCRRGPCLHFQASLPSPNSLRA